MTRRTTTVVALAAAALLTHLSPSRAANLSGEEIAALVTGKSASFKTVDGKYSGTITYRRNGTINITGNFPGFSKDTGVWSIKGGALCSTFKKVRNGQSKCDRITPVGGKSYRIGNAVATFR